MSHARFRPFAPAALLGAIAFVAGSSRAGAQGHASLPPSNDAAAARIAASPRHAEWVKIPWGDGRGDSLMAYVVYPITAREHSPVVVVVHEIFGLATWVRGVADQVAADGFIAIAPDLNSRVRGGPSTTELPRDSSVRIIANVPVADRVAGVTAAARYATSLASAERRYAVIGFCWGGSTVWSYAVNGGMAGYSGGVAYYGTPYLANGAPVADSLRKIDKPVMLLNGSLDPRIGAAMPAIEAQMKALGKDYFGRNYEGAVHGFMRAQDDPARSERNPDQERANLAASMDAWPRTVAFLKKQTGIQ
ncbi:MAG: dienelactone hydrolase family protein [Gemmatimonadaceae bacterium]|nr:dienelactone hydrolase family protein [Gemmatimonadaceae bacterium]